MSRYIRGDVVISDISYMDEEGVLHSKPRPMVVIDVLDESDNITVVCSKQTHKADKYPSIVVRKDSEIGQKMSIDGDTLIYCNATITLTNSDIHRRIGNCPIVKDICKILGYEYLDDV
jgi:hypothetical protein